MADKVLIIVPAHNEEAALPGVIHDIRTHQPRADIVVVDDASSDDTSATAHRLGAAVLRLPLNLGIGGAVQTGFRYARHKGYEYALQVDGDGQHPASAIADVLEPVSGGRADVAIGSRFLGREGFQSTFMRRVGIGMFRLLSRLTTGRTVTDSTSGFRAYNAAAIRYLAETYPSDYPEVEAVISLSRNRFRIVEVPVEMRERQGGQSSITIGRSAYYMIKVMLASLISNLKPTHRSS
ncbi:MAG: glycosyltransferase family 2 protein [Candidatus Krumholzibacteriia bacterium]